MSYTEQLDSFIIKKSLKIEIIQYRIQTIFL